MRFVMERSYLLLNTVLVFSHFVVTLCLHDKVTKFETLPDSKDKIWILYILQIILFTCGMNLAPFLMNSIGICLFVVGVKWWLWWFFVCFRKPEMSILSGKRFVTPPFLVKESFIFHDLCARLGSLCFGKGVLENCNKLSFLLQGIFTSDFFF